jgi:hypothetical protein
VLTINTSLRIDLAQLAPQGPFLSAAVLTVPVDHLPEVPHDWLPVFGREIATTTQRFVAYESRAGLRIGLHSVTALHPELTGRLIALVNLGAHRVAIHAGEHRFEARWTRGPLTHRLTAEPVTLGAFMDLVLNLRWRPAPSR